MAFCDLVTLALDAAGLEKYSSWFQGKVELTAGSSLEGTVPYGGHYEEWFGPDVKLVADWQDWWLSYLGLSSMASALAYSTAMGTSGAVNFYLGRYFTGTFGGPKTEFRRGQNITRTSNSWSLVDKGIEAKTGNMVALSKELLAYLKPDGLPAAQEAAALQTLDQAIYAVVRPLLVLMGLTAFILNFTIWLIGNLHADEIAEKTGKWYKLTQILGPVSNIVVGGLMELVIQLETLDSVAEWAARRVKSAMVLKTNAATQEVSVAIVDGAVLRDAAARQSYATSVATNVVDIYGMAALVLVTLAILAGAIVAVVEESK